jgi:hypothetical protein
MRFSKMEMMRIKLAKRYEFGSHGFLKGREALWGQVMGKSQPIHAPRQGWYALQRADFWRPRGVKALWGPVGPDEPC